MRRRAAGPRAWLDRWNARHPWSHNDHFHPWLLARLPERRDLAVDVGCGQGALLAELGRRFERAVGVDVDAGMRRAAEQRCAGMPGVTVVPELRGVPGGADVITMVAVLHHLDAPTALREVRARLAPGGRFLAVGLHRDASLRDLAWTVASTVTNPVIGLAKHPRPVLSPPAGDPFPTRDPRLSYDELAAVVARELPDARMRHRLGFRHTIEWTKA